MDNALTTYAPFIKEIKEFKKEFPGVQGFSTLNLWLMQSFYIEYSQMPNLQLLVTEIGRMIKALVSVCWG